MVCANLTHEVLYSGSIGVKSIESSQTHSTFQHNILLHCWAQLVAEVWPLCYTFQKILQRNYFDTMANIIQHLLSNVAICCITCVWLVLNRLSTWDERQPPMTFFLSLSSGGGFGGKETRNCFLSSVVAVAAAKWVNKYFSVWQPVGCFIGEHV